MYFGPISYGIVKFNLLGGGGGGGLRILDSQNLS